MRLMGFNAPELRPHHCRTAEGYARERALAIRARAALQLLVDDGVVLLVGHEVVIDKYKRTLAVMLTRSRIDVSKILIAAGLAEPYSCQVRCPKRKQWCDE